MKHPSMIYVYVRSNVVHQRSEEKMAPNVYGITYNRPCDKTGDKINSQQATNKSMAESAST